MSLSGDRSAHRTVTYADYPLEYNLGSSWKGVPEYSSR